VGFDPRGVGESEGAIDCAVNQEEEGVYGQPFVTEENFDRAAWVGRARRYVDRCIERNRDILPWVSTANVARDLDLLREAVGDETLNYLGFSYGTFLGATYQSLFPGRTRALALDGAVDPERWVDEPMAGLLEQSQGIERAMHRFFQSCAADKVACPYDGQDPWMAFDELLERVRAAPLPGPPGDPRPVDADDVLAGATLVTYAKQLWPLLARALSDIETSGNARIMRILTDAFYGRNADGTYAPGLDGYVTISAIDSRYPSGTRRFEAAGALSWGLFDYTWWGAGYVELPWGLFDVTPRGVFRGPFRTPDFAPTTLVVGTTYDPATPYKWARRMVRQLGNARLLTMRGDGHTAYGGNSACIDAAVDAYLEDLVVPAAGTTCRQEVPLTALRRSRASADAVERALSLRPHVKPLF
jgi:pimeloyl-ACP methyl ester carboxylesterase